MKPRTPLTRRERRLMRVLRDLYVSHQTRLITGQKMANVCWNGARKLLFECDQPCLADLAKEWDDHPHTAAAAARKLLEKKP